MTDSQATADRPALNAPSLGVEALPTREMIRAGAEVIEEKSRFFAAEALASMVYTAMQEAREPSA
jgi:hypothetical protein